MSEVGKILNHSQCKDPKPVARTEGRQQFAAPKANVENSRAQTTLLTSEMAS